MPEVHHTPSQEEDRYTREEVIKIMQKIMADQNKMFHQMNRTMDIFFFSLQNSIAWISNIMEELQQKLEYNQ